MAGVRQTHKELVKGNLWGGGKVENFKLHRSSSNPEHQHMDLHRNRKKIKKVVGLWIWSTKMLKITEGEGAAKCKLRANPRRYVSTTPKAGVLI